MKDLQCQMLPRIWTHWNKVGHWKHRAQGWDGGTLMTKAHMRVLGVRHLYLDCDGGYLVTFVKAHWTTHLKCVQVIVHKLYLNGVSF